MNSTTERGQMSAVLHIDPRSTWTYSPVFFKHCHFEQWATLLNLWQEATLIRVKQCNFCCCLPLDISSQSTLVVRGVWIEERLCCHDSGRFTPNSLINQGLDDFELVSRTVHSGVCHPQRLNTRKPVLIGVLLSEGEGMIWTVMEASKGVHNRLVWQRGLCSCKLLSTSAASKIRHQANGKPS